MFKTLFLNYFCEVKDFSFLFMELTWKIWHDLVEDLTLLT